MEKKLQTQPFVTLSFLTTTYIGIGHHLLFDAINTKFERTKNSIPYVLKANESCGKFDSEWTQRAKKDFIQSFSSLNEENTRKIKEIAEMQGIKLFDVAK